MGLYQLTWCPQSCPLLSGSPSHGRLGIPVYVGAFPAPKWNRYHPSDGGRLTKLQPTDVMSVGLGAAELNGDQVDYLGYQCNRNHTARIRGDAMVDQPWQFQHRIPILPQIQFQSFCSICPRMHCKGCPSVHDHG